MMNRASSLAYVKMSCTLVAHFTSQQLMSVRTTATDIIVDAQTAQILGLGDDIGLAIRTRDTSVLPSVRNLLEFNQLSCDTLLSVYILLSDTTYFYQIRQSTLHVSVLETITRQQNTQFKT